MYISVSCASFVQRCW